MSDGDYEIVELPVAVDALADLLQTARSARFVLLHHRGVAVPPEVASRLVVACASPMAASASPVPVADASNGSVVAVALDELLPPAPSVPFVCSDVCLLSVEALASVPLPAHRPGDDVAAWLVHVADELSRAGWRHVAAPGTAFRWSVEAPTGRSEGIWSSSAAAAVVGPANEGLSTHQLWSRTRLRPIRIVIDGACVTDGQHNGSQSVVIEISRALARRRPSADVAVAVRPEFLAAARRAVGSDVEVVERAAGNRRFDVVYRPYQLLDPHDVVWIEHSGDRVLLGQLDMIAFSNPTYHPSPALFHAVRNLQRSTMRRADAVTFISAFARETTSAECPDLDADRLFVVSCGADPMPPGAESLEPDGGALVGGEPFIACLSATFWHKNRRHAIAVFDALCRSHGYRGGLVLAGPEPYYGRSETAEGELIAALEPNVSDRIRRIGRVDEATKWWLLRHADLVLYPSVVEGFGLVPFEAAAVGTPSMSHGGSAVLEVLGDGPAVVGSWDVDRWAESASRLIVDPAASSEVLAQIGGASARHTWDAAADLTWTAIDRTLARPRAARFDEEGAIRSRVSDGRRGVTPLAGPMHFTNRVVSAARRRVGSWRTGRSPR